MLRTATLLVTAALGSLGIVSTSMAGGPFGLIRGHACCEKACDASPCDAAACEADPCQQAACDATSPCNACDADPCAKSKKLLGGLRCRQGCKTRCSCCSYCSVFGGWTTLDEYSGEGPTPPPPPIGPPLPPPDLQGTFSDGWAIGVAHGRRFNRAIRGELEFAFRSNTADLWTVNGTPSEWSGHLFTYSGMANLYHDFDNWSLAGCTPYIGGGIGLAIYDGDFQTTSTTVNIDDEAFAYQFIAGATKQLHHRNMELFAEYRFFGSTPVDVINTGVNPQVDFGELEPEFHNVFLGLRLFR